MRRLLLVAVVALGVAAPVAAGGGWATVQLSSLPRGESWDGELTVLQHGRTPLDGVAPVIRVTDDDGVVREFPSAATGEAGVYRFAVRFPGAGTYEYEVWDGFSQTHTYRPVTIGGAAGDGLPWLMSSIAAALVAALVAAAALLLRRRAQARPAGAPVLP